MTSWGKILFLILAMSCPVFANGDAYAPGELPQEILRGCEGGSCTEESGRADSLAQANNCPEASGTCLNVGSQTRQNNNQTKGQSK